jgi:transposase
MPRGTELSDFEKGRILAFQEMGLSNRDIATRLGRSHNVVDNFIKKKDGYGKKKRSGRRPKLSDRDKRSIVRAASNSTKGVRRIRDECKPNVSKDTIWRAIKSSPHLARQKLKVNPKLKPEHEVKRMNFAKEHVTWTHNWDTVSLYLIFP